jgi:hypothetical protein
MAMAWRERIAWLRGDLEEAEGLARAALAAGEVLREWWRLIPAAVLIEALVDQARPARWSSEFMSPRCWVVRCLRAGRCARRRIVSN